MLSKGIKDEMYNRLYGKIINIIKRYISDGVNYYDLKRFYKTKNNINIIASEIQSDGERNFDKKQDYIDFVADVVKDVITDIISEDETKKLSENKLYRYNDFINENLLKGKSEEQLKSVLTDNEMMIEYIKQGMFDKLPRNEKGVCIYDGNLDLHYEYLTKLPDNLTITGDLDCGENELTELPENLNVGGWLECSDNKITSLPESLIFGDGLYCSNNQITSIPDNLVFDGDLNCCDNQITKLPENLYVVGYFLCSYNNLTELPDNLYVGGHMDCFDQNTGVVLELPKSANVKGEFNN